ncbi:MAG: thioredoxin domain-containing protein [Desulfosalsimonadaceae bacterium]
MNTQAAKTNRLKNEKSPYLLQHADNPVDWYPWGDEAFEKAKTEDKPILVSIGYSTCHWCHVMAHESFSDPETAALMNRHFVNIKVDREERPDIDRIYISAVSAMTGSAGWPLNVFLAPDGRPFYGGTYFPPARRAGPSWQEILTAVSEAYKDPDKRKELLQSADKIEGFLKEYLDGDTSGTQAQLPGPEMIDLAIDAVSGTYDQKYGGFNTAPKFPMPPILNFLLFANRFAAHTKMPSQKSRKAMDMALQTLEEMAAGGIYDHLGGGFHRYATDAAWHVPHFEKMLYDNAQLIRVYIDAYEATGNKTFATVAKEALGYVLREMTHPEGAFYSAEDADSPYVDLSRGDAGEAADGEKSEGGFYVWRHDEIMHTLNTVHENSVFDMFAYHYGVKPDGNVKSDPMGEFTGKNILHRVRTIEETAKRFDRSKEDVSQALLQARQTLFDARNRRPRPHLDDKVLVEWNGLMISALAGAYRVFGDTQYLNAADAAIAFIYERMYTQSDTPELFRRWREGERSIPAMAEDYAFLVQGLLDTYEAGFNASHLEWAVSLANRMLDLFYDEARGGFYTTADGQDRHLLMKAKDATDNVMPSVDAVSVMNFIRLHRYTGNPLFEQAADHTLKASVNRMKKHPGAMPAMIRALGMHLLRYVETIVVGSMDTEAAETLTDVIRAYPREAVSPAWIDGEADRDILSVHMPHVKEMESPGNRPRVFVCFDRTCQAPVTEPEMLKSVLDKAFEFPLQGVS